MPLSLPRRTGGASWGRRRVTVQERLDGSLWVRDGSELYPLSPAPPSAPILRARHLSRVPELISPPEPPRTPLERAPSAASASRPKPEHPWHRYPAVRPR